MLSNFLFIPCVQSQSTFSSLESGKQREEYEPIIIGITKLTSVSVVRTKKTFLRGTVVLRFVFVFLCSPEINVSRLTCRHFGDPVTKRAKVEFRQKRRIRVGQEREKRKSACALYDPALNSAARYGLLVRRGRR